MPFRTRAYVKEIGSAVAVLAIYMLVLLAPLHHAAGLQRDFSALGYVSIDTTSVCAALAQDENGQPTAKCAAAGLGKNEIAAVEPVVIAFDAQRVATVVSYLVRTEPVSSTLEHHPGRPRAPPVLI